MKINFDHNLEEYQRAHRLRLLLEHAFSNELDNSIRPLIKDLKRQVDEFLTSPELQELGKKSGSDVTESVASFETGFKRISSFWNFIFGPSRRELQLSRQRREMIERAEHAENIAFQALAETSDTKKQYEDAMQNIRRLEQELIKLHKTR
jgi:hypothetical protein